MKIKMLKDFRASLDGVNIETLKEKVEYDVPTSLGRDLVEVLKVAKATFKKIPVEDVPPDKKDLESTKPSDWVGLKLKDKESGDEKVVASTSGNQVFFEGDAENPVDYRLVRKNMEIM